MDVKYINPFLQGTMEVLMKMSSLSAVAGKPYIKEGDIAPGDISGIIGITGEAVGSLAISFKESCICSIVTGMLNELHMEINKDVIDAVGEITNMISGAARSRLERQGMILYAAIPTVVFGKDHTLRHILKHPSIVIPFKTDGGVFYVDVCLKSVQKKAADPPPRPEVQPAQNIVKPYQKPAVTSLYSSGHKSAVHQPKSTIEKPPSPPPPVADEEVKPTLQQTPKTPAEKIEALKKAMEDAAVKREQASLELKNNPFMPLNERKKYNKLVDTCDAAIKRMKLDISAIKMLAEIKDGDMEIKTHYQHYDNSKIKK